MAKRKNRSKRSLGSLPKGLPIRKGADSSVNPFEVTSRQKRPKHQVHNRHLPGQAKRTQPSALAQALAIRKTQLREQLQASKKANVFHDKRIGEYDHQMTADEQNLARLVRERSRRSKRVSKYSLEDDDNSEIVLTHKGKSIDSLTTKDHVILSDDEEDVGNLDAADTSLHFGGITGEADPYGTADMSTMYASRKTELDDLILRRKIMKAEKLRNKEEQTETFQAMDESFDQLAQMLSFRDKEKEIRDHIQAKRAGNLSEEDQQFAEWDKQMKQYQFLERKVKATDRTKTQEEIAKEKAERLHELETRRLARMNGDFDEDDFSDLSDDEDNKKKRKKARRGTNAEILDDSSEEESVDELQTRFTADGLVQVDRNGSVIQKEDGKSDDDKTRLPLLEVGTKVTASYRAKEQFDGHESWYSGVVSTVNRGKDGSITYDIEYDDGDFESAVEPQDIRLLEKSAEDEEKLAATKAKEAVKKQKRQKAKEKARTDIPYVFEVPTTLDALHDMIANYASTGDEASLIIQRIHASNSVRLDRRNAEKMQNFYDVLLRRFVAVGDAIYKHGDGGPELGRYKQLDKLTQTMYEMAQDSPECAGAVWGRRLGVFQNAHAKRLRDAELETDDDEADDFTAWPSVGVFLTLRAMGHIFPVTDQRHHVVTPVLLLLGQMVAQTPVQSMYDLIMGTMCSALLVEYTKEAKRISPEALAFLASAVRLFAVDFARQDGAYVLPSLAAAGEEELFSSIRSDVVSYKEKKAPQLTLEQEAMQSNNSSVALLSALLQLIETSVHALAGSLESAEKEAFAEILESLLSLRPKSKSEPFPECIQTQVASVAAVISQVCRLDEPRIPVLLRSAPSRREVAIKSLAPRMENPDKYSMSKDKGKKAKQAAIDRTRREYKREHKAVSRELRLDSAFVERERREEKEKKDSAEKAKRQKAFAWLESEQAVMNQQVRQGGGLLSGGGMGAAKAKAATAKLGIKKGGKFF